MLNPIATAQFASGLFGQIIGYSLGGGYDGPGSAAFISAWKSLAEAPMPNGEPAPAPAEVELVRSRRRNRNRFRRKLRGYLAFLAALIAVTALAAAHPVMAQPDPPTIDAGSEIDLLLSSGAVASQAIIDSVDVVWNDQFPLLLTSVATVATILAVISVIELIMEMIAENQQYGAPNWTRLIFPITIASVIASLVFTAAIPVSIRNELNTLNRGALDSIGFAASFQQAKSSSSFESRIAPLFEACNNVTQAQRPACIESASTQADAILDAEASLLPPGTAPWINRWKRQISGIARDAVQNPQNVLSNVQTAILSPVIETVAFFFLNELQVGFQMLMEVALLLTALLFPMALARGIATDGETVAGWAFSMFQVGMVKFFFTIVAGLSSLIYLAIGGVGSSLWFAVLTGVLAPFLAFDMVRGGGLGVLSTILAVAGSVAKIALRVIK